MGIARLLLVAWLPGILGWRPQDEAAKLVVSTSGHVVDGAHGASIIRGPRATSSLLQDPDEHLETDEKELPEEVKSKLRPLRQDIKKLDTEIAAAKTAKEAAEKKAVAKEKEHTDKTAEAAKAGKELEEQRAKIITSAIEAADKEESERTVHLKDAKVYLDGKAKEADKTAGAEAGTKPANAVAPPQEKKGMFGGLFG